MLDPALLALILIVVLGLIFDFINGFHDTANAIATSVATRVLSPGQAVSMAAVLNVVGALTGTAVATTVGKGIIDLEVLEARIPADGGNWARVVAPDGVYDRAANTLSLSREIVVTTTDGAVARLSSALLDIGASTLKSSEPVELERHGSWVTAASMEMLDGGNRLIFETRVRMNIVPASADAGKQQASGGTNAVN